MKKKIILGIFFLAFPVVAINASNQNDDNYNNQGSENLFETLFFYSSNQDITKRNQSKKTEPLSEEAIRIRENSPIIISSQIPSVPVYVTKTSPIENSSFSKSFSMNLSDNKKESPKNNMQNFASNSTRLSPEAESIRQNSPINNSGGHIPSIAIYISSSTHNLVQNGNNIQTRETSVNIKPLESKLQKDSTSDAISKN